MLSFGEEAEEEEKELATVKTKIKSSHDVLDDPRLLKEESLNKELVRIHNFKVISCHNLRVPVVIFLNFCKWTCN